MTSDPPGPQPPSAAPNVAALVEAIDARSRQAGAESATEVMQRMLASLTEVLGGIEDRLDHVEEALTSGGGGIGGAPGLAEAVQAGLATFNARLGRLEEAFVQAVDESGSGTRAVVDEVRTAVTSALAESSPAERGGRSDPAMLAALGRVESALSALVAERDERPAQDAIERALDSLGARLDGLEQRLVAAVHAPPPPPVDLSPVSDRLAGVERRMSETPRDVTAAVESAFEVVQVRIAGLEQLLRERPTDRADPATAVRAAVAPLVERMDELQASSRSTSARTGDAFGRVEAAVAALPGRFSSLEERVWAAVSSVTEGAASAVDATVLARLEEAVDRLDRDETSARLVKLVEERMSVGLRAVTERTDEVRRGLEQLSVSAAASAASSADDDGALDDLVASVRALQSATRDVPDEVGSTITARLVPFGDRLAGLEDRLDALVAASAALTDLRADSARLASQLDAVSARLAEPPVLPASLASDVASLAAQVESLAGRPDGSAAVAARLESLAADVVALAARPDGLEAVTAELDSLAAQVRAALAAADRDRDAGTSIEAIVEQINGAVRREAELLTQRVAALAVGVEASRVLLEQHLQESENSIGRKAGEVTRRLAADFGITSKRTGAPGGRRDPRELGSG